MPGCGLFHTVVYLTLGDALNVVRINGIFSVWWGSTFTGVSRDGVVVQRDFDYVFGGRAVQASFISLSFESAGRCCQQ